MMLFERDAIAYKISANSKLMCNIKGDQSSQDLGGRVVGGVPSGRNVPAGQQGFPVRNQRQLKQVEKRNTIEHRMVDAMKVIVDLPNTRVFFVGGQVFGKSATRPTDLPTLPTYPGTTSGGRHGWGRWEAKGRNEMTKGGRDAKGRGEMTLGARSGDPSWNTVSTL